MFDIQNYASFLAAIVVFQLIPGPGTLAILNATARGGVGAGMGAVLGTLAGDFVYMLAAVLGLAAILAAHPQVLAAAQWLGIAYLCWLGVKLLFARGDAGPAGAAARRDGRVHFRQAFAVSLTNPKVVMFFMAFFPLFLRPGIGARHAGGDDAARDRHRLRLPGGAGARRQRGGPPPRALAAGSARGHAARWGRADRLRGTAGARHP